MATKLTIDLVRLALQMRNGKHALFGEFGEMLRYAASAPDETLQEIADLLIEGVCSGTEDDADASVSAINDFLLSGD